MTIPFQSRVESGRTIYTVPFQANCVIRPLVTPATSMAAAHSVIGSPLRQTEAQGSEGDGKPGGDKPAGDGSEVRVVWRLLSAVQAWPVMGWEPMLVDYSHDSGKAIRDLVELINATKPDLVWNHSYDVRNIAGRLENALWEDSGDIPPGINGDLVVDPEFDEKAAVGLAKGHLRKGSIAAIFEMVQSHPEMDYREFARNIGREINGETVRWLPTAGVEVLHFALVWAGADKHAQARNEAGEVSNRGGQPANQANAELVALASKVDSLRPVVVASGEEAVSLEEVVNRLSLQAADGRTYLEDLKKEAERLFRLAHFDPMREGLPEGMQSRLEQVRAVQSVAEAKVVIDEYKPKALGQFGPVTSMRSSAGEQLPPEQVKADELAGKRSRIADGVEDVFGSRKDRTGDSPVG